ncbi:MAG: hypothetical protein H6540_03075 [Bacteroidales bacterium]|nr:hypothetical protein [Bacteroidales bacterium]MCB9013870.1 hypothetical protein [Bacteroidales bacterium]
MKRYIIITVMSVLALSLQAQTTDRSSRTRATSTTTTTRSSDTEKKTTPATSTTRSSSAVKATPSYNESRNRENPAVRTTTATRKVESSPAPQRSAGNTETRSNTTTRSSSNTTTQRSTGNSNTNRSSSDVNRNPNTERKVGGTTSTSRSTAGGNNGSVVRNSGSSREVNVESNRVYVPRTEQVYVEKRQSYRTPQPNRSVRIVNTNTSYVYHPVEYRRTYYPYKEPRHVEIIWNARMYNDYRYLYPNFDYWYYPYGYSIRTISAYDADRFIGDVARIYGRVDEVWYERQSDNYYLYFGAPYPYQDFTVILSGNDARRFSYRPERYFTNRNLVVTGLVSMWDGKPEMLIKRKSQVETYF